MQPPDPSFLDALTSTESLLTIGIIILLLFCSGFFSGSETSLTAASRPTLHKLEKDGDKRAQTVNRLIANPERLIGGILLGNNLVNILASALATSLFVRIFGDAGVALATLIMTALVLIFAEVLPKTYAIINSDRMAMVVAPFIRAVITPLAPIVAGVQVIVRGTLRAAGANIEPSRNVLSAHEELRGAIDLHLQQGAVPVEDHGMLGGILDLRELEISDVMVHRKAMKIIDADQPPEVIVADVLNAHHTRIPIYRGDQDNIVGILHAKEVLRALAEAGWDSSKLNLDEIAADPWFVPDTTPVKDQLRAFLQKNAHIALVVDEYGTLMGLVTLEDILEEIVGDIADEHDRTVMGVRRHAGGAYHVNGTVAIRDLNRALHWTLPDDEATTIAGLVIHEAQMIPDAGQVFSFHGFKFEILRRYRNQITAIRITPPRGAAPERLAADEDQNMRRLRSATPAP